MKLFKISSHQAYIWSPFLWISNSLLAGILIARLILKIFGITALNYSAFLIYLVTDMIVSPFMDLASTISRSSSEYPLEVMATALTLLAVITPILALKYMATHATKSQQVKLSAPPASPLASVRTATAWGA